MCKIDNIMALQPEISTKQKLRFVIITAFALFIPKIWFVSTNQTAQSVNYRWYEWKILDHLTQTEPCEAGNVLAIITALKISLLILS